MALSNKGAAAGGPGRIGDEPPILSRGIRSEDQQDLWSRFLTPNPRHAAYAASPGVRSGARAERESPPDYPARDRRSRVDDTHDGSIPPFNQSRWSTCRRYLILHGKR